MNKNKAYEYAEAVVNGVIHAPEQVRQICENFIYEFDVLQHKSDYSYKWNIEIERKVIGIVKRLNFARGAKARQSIYDNLAPFQHFLLMNIFCWVYREFPTRRKISEVIFTVARKNAKSVVAVVVHIVAMFLDEPNATHYIGSNTEKQAKIIFDEMTMIIKASPAIRKYFSVKKTYIEFMPEDIGNVPAKSCKLEFLSGDASKADGTQVFVASVDELGASNEIQKMVSSLETGQYGPENPLIMKVSTSYPVVNETNYWQDTIARLYANTFAFANKYLGREPDEDEEVIEYVPRTFGLAYLIDNPLDEIEVDGKTMKRWENPAVWVEANPLFSFVPSLWEKLVEDYHIKKQVPSDFHLFKVKNLNMWLSSSLDEQAHFVDSVTANKYVDDNLSSWESWRGKTVFIGLDVSLSLDNTAVTFAYYDADAKGDNPNIFFKNIVFYPKLNEADKSRTEGIPYAQWSHPDVGWCMALGEDTVDWVGIGQLIEEIVKEYDLNVATVLYDDTYAHKLMDYIDNHVEMQMSPARVHQDSKNLGPIISELQKQIYDGKVRYAPNKFLTGSFVNGLIEFRRGKVYITKDSKRRNKIDSLFSTLNAYKGILAFERNGYFNMSYEVSWF